LQNKRGDVPSFFVGLPSRVTTTTIRGVIFQAPHKPPRKPCCNAKAPPFPGPGRGGGLPDPLPLPGGRRLRCGGFGSGATPPGTAKHWEKYGYDQWIGSRENCTGNPIFNGKKNGGSG